MQQPMLAPPLILFCAAAPEDAALLSQWEIHLRPLQHAGLISFWSEQHLIAGASREHEREYQLAKSNLIFLLLSADFFVSQDCLAAMERALERSREGKALVIPLLLRPVAWEESSLNGLLSWPSNGVPITQWSHQDEAWHACVQNLRSMLGRRVSLPLPPRPADKPIDTDYKQVLQVSRKFKQKSTKKRTIIGYSTAIILLTIVVITSTFLIYLRMSQAESVSPAELAWQDYINATRGTPDINDPLMDNSQGRWSGGSTNTGESSFIGNAYHIQAFQQGSYAYGYESQLSVNDVAFEVSVTMLSGNPGVAGVVLGYGSSSMYIITIDHDQNYEVDQIENTFLSGQSSTLLARNKTPLIHSGFNHSNLIEVLARNNRIELYINNSYVTTISNTIASGNVGFVVGDDNGPFEAVFQNFKLWT